MNWSANPGWFLKGTNAHYVWALIRFCVLLVPLSLWGCSPAHTAGIPRIFYVRADNSSDEQNPKGQSVSVESMNLMTFEKAVILKPIVGGAYSRVSFSKDHKRIAYLLGEGVWISDPDGSNSRKVLSGYPADSFIWLDDDQLLLMGTKKVPSLHPEKDWDYYLYDASSDVTRPLTMGSQLYYCLQPGISQQSGQVTLLGQRDFGIGHFRIQADTIYPAIDILIDRSRLLNSSTIDCLAWTPGAGAIVMREESRQFDNLILTTDKGKTFQQITSFERDYSSSTIHDFSISPDGKRVILVVDLVRPNKPDLITGVGGETLALLNTETRDLTVISQNLLHTGAFVWSPDSRQVAMSLAPLDSRSNERRQIYSFDIGTKTLTQLTSDAGYKEVFDWH